MPGRKQFFISIAILLPLSIMILNQLIQQPNLGERATVTIHETVSVRAEVSDEPGEIMEGLMFRQSLGENDGMLFVFPDPATRNFWMKNTLIPLDLIFISESLSIVDIRNAIPCATDPCQIYTSKKPARYVLEVNGGFAAAKRIKEGDTVKLGEKILERAMLKKSGFSQ